MKRKRITVIGIILCVVMLLVSCTAPNPVPIEKNEIETEELLQTKEPETVEPETEPEAPYTWIAEPGTISGDVQPIYNVMTNDICGFGMSIVSDNSVYRLIDSMGEIKGTLYSDGYCYCAVCKGITDHQYLVNPKTYIPEEYMGGHGGLNNTPYIYDTETGEIYQVYIGGYEKIEDKTGAMVVQLCKKSPVPEDEKDFYSTDFVFETATGYGLTVNGELVQSNFEMYSRYSCGVVALCRDGKWGYYDTRGNELLPCEYNASTQQLSNSLSEPIYVPYQATYGVIALSRFGKWGYADINGNMLTDFEFEEARPVYLNRGWVKTEEGWGVIELDYSFAEATDDEIREYLLKDYVKSDDGVPEYVGDTTYYETECKMYRIADKYTYYVTLDGKVITAIY